MKTEFHTIGQDRPVYLIAEIGLNHNGQEDLAIRMVEAAASSGAHCAKFQWFDSNHFIDPEATLGDGGPGSLQEFFRSFELTYSSWERIASACRKHKLDFLCSVFDEPSLDLYQKLNPFAVKIASTDLTYRSFLELIARRGLPIMLSTGASSEEEIQRTVDWIGSPDLLFQCVSSYPARPEDYNLRVLSIWQEKYGCLTGLSDHCMDLDVSLQVPALGGVAIERHFTLDRSMNGPDHSLSSTPEQFQELSRKLQGIQRILGDGAKTCKPSEEPVRQGGRRAARFLKDLPEGHPLASGDLIYMRPGADPEVGQNPESSEPGRSTDADRSSEPGGSGGWREGKGRWSGPEAIHEVEGLILARPVKAGAMLLSADLLPERRA